jgi:hypothetical protein
MLYPDKVIPEKGKRIIKYINVIYRRVSILSVRELDNVMAESNNIILLYLFFMCGADYGGEKELRKSTGKKLWRSSWS